MLPLEHAAASPPQHVFMEAAAKGEVAKASCDPEADGHRVQSVWAWLCQPEGHVWQEDSCSLPVVGLLMGGAALAGGLRYLWGSGNKPSACSCARLRVIKIRPHFAAGSLTNGHKMPGSHCGAWLLPPSPPLSWPPSGRSAHVEPHATCVHWPQAHLSTTLPPAFLSHWGIGWPGLLFGCKHKKGRGYWCIWEKKNVENWFHSHHFIVLALVQFQELVTPQQGWPCDRNKVSLFAPGPWAPLGAVSHWTVSNAFSCSKLWACFILSHFLGESSCIKRL